MPTKAKPKPKGKRKKAAPKGKNNAKRKPKTRVRGGYDRGARRWYTDDEREHFRAMIKACGGNCGEVARRTGVPERTLQQWWSGSRCPEAAQLSAEKEGRLADAAEELAWLFAAIMPEKVYDADLRQLAGSFGIMVDKMQVLRDQPSSITRNQNTNANVAVPLESLAENYAKLTDEQRTTFTRLLGVVTGRAGGGGERQPLERGRQITDGEEVPAVLT